MSTDDEATRQRFREAGHGPECVVAYRGGGGGGVPGVWSTAAADEQPPPALERPVVVMCQGYFPVALRLQDGRIAVVLRGGTAHVGLPVPGGRLGARAEHPSPVERSPPGPRARRRPCYAPPNRELCSRRMVSMAQTCKQCTYVVAVEPGERPPPWCPRCGADLKAATPEPVGAAPSRLNAVKTPESAIPERERREPASLVAAAPPAGSRWATFPTSVSLNCSRSTCSPRASLGKGAKEC